MSYKIKLKKGFVSLFFLVVNIPFLLLASDNNLSKVTNEFVQAERKIIQISDQERVIQGEYIVQLHENQVARLPKESYLALKSENQRSYRFTTTYTANALAAKVNGEITHVYSSAISGFAIKMDKNLLGFLAADPRVKSIEPNQGVRLQQVVNENYATDRIDQRHLPLDGQYNASNDGSGVNVYVIDSGINSVSQLSGRLKAGTNTTGSSSSTSDCAGHGTAVAGIVGSINNINGVVGVAPGVNLYPVRVSNCGPGFIPNSYVIAGVDWVAANARYPAVVNMSLGTVVSDFPTDSALLSTAINNAMASGITFVAAAGNHFNPGDVERACEISPASIPGVITVGATDATDQRASFSNYDACVDLFAPGDRVLTLHIGGAYTRVSGTSFSSPMVAGIAARYLARQTTDSPAQVSAAIVSNATNGVLSNIGTGSPNKLAYSGFLDGSGLSSGNILEGTNGADTVYLNSGSIGTATIYKDTVYGNGGDDIIYTNNEADRVHGGTGNDTIGGGAGDDILFGEDGNDTIFGGPGNDKIYGGPGADNINGGPGSDVILNLSQSVLPFASFGSQDVINGGEGDDIIIVSAASADYIEGGAGSDTYVLVGTAAEIQRTNLRINDLSGDNVLILQGVSQGEMVLTNNFRGGMELLDPSGGTIFSSSNFSKIEFVDNFSLEDNNKAIFHQQ